MTEPATELERLRDVGGHHAIDLMSALLDNWLDQANQCEQSACQTRAAVVFGMALFVTGGAASLAALKLGHLALIFATVTAFIAAFLNLLAQREQKAWRETGRSIARIHCLIIDAVRSGVRDVDLQALMRQESDLIGNAPQKSPRSTTSRNRSGLSSATATWTGARRWPSASFSRPSSS